MDFDPEGRQDKLNMHQASHNLIMTALPHSSTWKSLKGVSLCLETRPTHQLCLQGIAAIFHAYTFFQWLFIDHMTI